MRSLTHLKKTFDALIPPFCQVKALPRPSVYAIPPRLVEFAMAGDVIVGDPLAWEPI
jgi:hypothetical protein